MSGGSRVRFMYFGASSRFFFDLIGIQLSRFFRKVFVTFLILTAASFGTSRADSVVVFNEIMYHPLTNETKSEWVELHNQMAVNIDLSGWSLDGGIHFTFPAGTVILGRNYLVVSISPVDLKDGTGLTNVVGPFTGRLSNSGDTLRLYNNNQRLMDELTYDVQGEWPVGPDGSGVSLSKRDEDSASSVPGNWSVSPLVGGTPGRRNFAVSPIEITNTTPVLIGSSWRFLSSDINSDPAWNQIAFDDSAWSSGEGIFQAGTVIPPFGDPESVSSIFSTGVDDKGAVRAPGTADTHYLLTQSAQTTSPPPPLPASPPPCRSPGSPRDFLRRRRRPHHRRWGWCRAW